MRPHIVQSFHSSQWRFHAAVPVNREGWVMKSTSVQPALTHLSSEVGGGDLCGVTMQILGFLLSSIIDGLMTMAQVSGWRSAALLEKRKMMAHQLRPQCGRSQRPPLGVRLYAGLESFRLTSSSLIPNLISSFSQFKCIIRDLAPIC